MAINTKRTFVDNTFMPSNLDDEGFILAKNFISQERIAVILREMESSSFNPNTSGIRHIHKKLPSVAQYSKSDEFAAVSKNYLNPQHSLVRSILFNKTPEANWYVTWHQDKTVAVTEKFDDPEWKTWSIKENILHVQPPLAVLDSMVTIRIHLDETTRNNGCLKIIPASHKYGILSQDRIDELIAKGESVYCEAQAGDALIMRPHLLHSSSKSIDSSNRRVLHLEFSSWQLPEGIKWA